MLAVVKIFWQLSLRRLGPEDLPDSGFFLGVTLAIYIAAQFITTMAVYGTVPGTVPLVGMDTLMLCGFTWAVLALTRNLHRFRQTLASLLGTGALLTLLATPFSLWSVSLEGAARTGPSLIVLVIMVWLIIVYAHVYSRAVSRPFGVGVVLAVAYYLLNILMLEQALRRLI
jgi:hypothetical protein